tara:strand:+ start:734 stop:928 length:195 start_codon:yes stop_codon:yes gene_type:complete
MNNKEVEEMMNRIVAETVMKIITNTPASISAGHEKSAETMAWIELHEDVLDEAYNMSKEIREYE